MTHKEKTLSYQLDQARQMEEHYRALLLFWKQRRQHLEAYIPNEVEGQLPGDNVFSQILEIAQKAWNNDRPN